MKLQCARSPAAALFAALWWFIASVSVHDGYLVALRRDVIRHSERNPLGQYLIRCNDGGIGLLLSVKAIGTTAACSLLLLMYQNRRELALAVAGPVAGFQFLLLVYMTFQ
jgi:hypothetical protein